MEDYKFFPDAQKLKFLLPMVDDKKGREKKQKSELGGLLGLITMTIVIVGILMINKNPQMVAGVRTQKEVVQNVSEKKSEEKISDNVKANVSENLDKIKEQVAGLSAQDLMSSSPQIQKVIKDLQDLQKYPKNQAKEACLKICEGL